VVETGMAAKMVSEAKAKNEAAYRDAVVYPRPGPSARLVLQFLRTFFFDWFHKWGERVGDELIYHRL